MSSTEPIAAELDAEAQLRQVRRENRTRRASAVMVLVLAVLTAGSALFPPFRDRMHLIHEVLPFIAVRAASTTSVLVAGGLVVAARGLRQGHRMAWLAGVSLLLYATGLHVIKGLDLEEAAVCLFGAGWLISHHRAFRVLPGWAQARRAFLIATGAALAGTCLTALVSLVFARRGHPRAGETWRAAAERLGGRSYLPLPGIGPVATPLLSLLGITIVLSVLWIVLSPRISRSLSPEQRRWERERARAVVMRYGRDTLAYFALRDDKDWFFTGDSVVAYAVRRGVCLVSPDPIGPQQDRYQTWADFIGFAQGHGWAVAVVGASRGWLPVYENSGLRASYLGDEAILDVTDFSLAGSAMKSLRQAVNRVERAGVSAAFHTPTDMSEQVRDQVRRIAGLSRRGDDERGFSMTLSRLADPVDAELLLVTAQDAQGRVLGFIQWIPAASISGWSLDVMRRDTDEATPNGVIDFLIVKTIERVAAEGGKGLCLNFAVLRETMTTPATGPAGQALQRVLGIVSQHSQLESLGRFNDKFKPQWNPRYVVRGDGTQLVGQLYALAEAEGLVELPAGLSR